MILCCGEALIDMLPQKLDDGSECFVPIPGGALLNTAIALGRLGEETSFFSSLSSDMFGQQLIAALEHSGVDTGLCVRSPNPSTLAFVNLKDGQATYYFFDENSAARNLTPELLPSLPATVTAIHFGGISLIPEPGGSSYEKLMTVNQDRLLSFDPNIRPGFIQDEMGYRGRVSRMIEMADIVKVSDEDLNWIADGRPVDETIASWLQETDKIVLLTEGANGATAYIKSGTLHQPAIETCIVDTVGAGDAFNAGFLAGLGKAGLLSKSAFANIDIDVVSLKAALTLAVEVAAHTVSITGANPPFRLEL